MDVNNGVKSFKVDPNHSGAFPQRRRQTSFNNTISGNVPIRRWSAVNVNPPIFSNVNTVPGCSVLIPPTIYPAQDLLSMAAISSASAQNIFPLTSTAALQQMLSNSLSLTHTNNFVGSRAKLASVSGTGDISSHGPMSHSPKVSPQKPMVQGQTGSTSSHPKLPIQGKATWGVIAQKNNQQALISCTLFSSESVHFIPFTRKDYVTGKFQDIKVDDVVLFQLTSEDNKWRARQVMKYVPVTNEPAPSQETSIVHDTVLYGEILSLHEPKKKGARERSKSCSVSADAQKNRISNEDDGVIAYTQEKEQFYLPFCLSDVKSNQHLQVHDQVQFLLKHDYLKNEGRAVHIVKLTNPQTTVLGRIKSLKDNYGFLERADSVVEVYFPFHSFPDPAFLKEGQECAFNIHSLRNGRVEAQNIRLLPPGTVRFMEEGHAIQQATVMRPPNSKRRLDEQSGQLAWIEDNCRQLPFGLKCQNNAFSLHPGDQVTFRISRDQRDDSLHVVDIHLPIEHVPRGTLYSPKQYPPDCLGEQSGLRAPRFLAYILHCPSNATVLPLVPATTSSPYDGLLLMKEYSSDLEIENNVGPLKESNTPSQLLTALKTLLWQCENKTMQPYGVDAFKELIGELFSHLEDRPLCITFSHDEIIDLNEHGPLELFQLVEVEPLKVAVNASHSIKHRAPSTSVQSTDSGDIFEASGKSVDLTEPSVTHQLHGIRICRASTPFSAQSGMVLLEGEIVVEATDKAVRHSITALSTSDEQSSSISNIPVVPGSLGVIRYSLNNVESSNSVYYSLASLGKGIRNRPKVGDKVQFHLVEITTKIRFAVQVTQSILTQQQQSVSQTKTLPPSSGILKSRSASCSSSNTENERKYERTLSTGSASSQGSAKSFRKQLSYEQPLFSPRGLDDVIETSGHSDVAEEGEEDYPQTTKEGWIVFLGDSFGFIESSDHRRSLYFPLSLVDPHARDQLVLGQAVTYVQTVSPANQQLMARDVKLIDKPSPTLSMPEPQPEKKFGKVIVVAGKTGRAGERLANGTIEEEGTRQQYWYSPKSLRYLATFLQVNDRVEFHVANCSDQHSSATRWVHPKFRANWAVDVTSDMPRYVGRVCYVSDKQGKVCFYMNDSLRETFHSVSLNAASNNPKKPLTKPHAASVSEPPVINESSESVLNSAALPKIRARSSTSVSSFEPIHLTGSGDSSDHVGGSLAEVLPPPLQVSKPLNSQSTVMDWERATQLSMESVHSSDILDHTQQLTFPIASVLDQISNGLIHINDIVTFQVCSFSANLGGRNVSTSSISSASTICSYMATNLLRFPKEVEETTSSKDVNNDTLQREQFCQLSVPTSGEEEVLRDVQAVEDSTDSSSKQT